MVYFLLLLYVVQVLSESLLPPQDVHVDNGLLTWTHASQNRNVTYSVQYIRRGKESAWQNLEECVQTSLNSCNVTSIRPKNDRFGCMMLRVKANTLKQESKEVDACNTHNDSCTPYVNLTASTESLTVHLIKRHNLYHEYADTLKQRIYFGKEGERLKMKEDFLGSTTISDLQPGQRYCVSVQYVYYDEPIGLSTCELCEVIPPSRLKQSDIIIAIVIGVIVPVVLVTLIAYILMFRLGKIKKWLQLPIRIPPDFNDRFNDLQVPIYASAPTEEVFDVITITPKQ